MPMTASFDIRFLVMHDPCMPPCRAPVGAVPAGSDVTLRLWANPDTGGAINKAWLAVGTPCANSEGLSWEFEALAREDNGFRAVIHTPETPTALFYFFALELVDGSLACYVPQRDARSTAGELHLISSVSLSELMTSPNVLEQELSGLLPADGLAFQVTCYEPSFTTPNWLAGAVMYQVFPDRFTRGGHGVHTAGIEAHRAKGRPVRLHEEWNAPLVWDADGAYDPLEFYGGTLEGIREKLPYLASLGVEVLYLNPIFEARSYHRYDTADYEHVDPLLGSDDDFLTLAQEARELDIRIVLDAVLSHTGADSRYFKAGGNYPESGAAEDEASPYRDWYDFAHPNGDKAPYRCWWGDPSLPEVDERNPSWQRYILGEAQGEGEWTTGTREYASDETAASPADSSAAHGNAADDDTMHGDTARGNTADGGTARGNTGILGRWLAAGASGYRLDVADELPDDVLERIRQSVHAVNPDAAIIGEVWEDATNKRSYGHWRRFALGRSLDSVMNYPLREALLDFAIGAIDAWQLATFLKRQHANYPPALYACLMNLMSSHDVERQRSVLALGRSIRHLPRAQQAKMVASITSDQDKQGAALQRLLAGLLYALPGMPCLYYGDEKGMQGGADPFCRAPFPSSDEGETTSEYDAEGGSARPRTDQGRDLTRFYQKLGQLRQGNATLRKGSMGCLALGADALCICRAIETGPKNTAAFENKTPLILACVNRGAEPLDTLIDLAALLPAQPNKRQDGCFRLFWSSRDIANLSAPENTVGETPLRFPCENGLIRVRIPAASCVYLENAPLDAPHPTRN